MSSDFSNTASGGLRLKWQLPVREDGIKNLSVWTFQFDDFQIGMQLQIVVELQCYPRDTERSS